MINNKIFIQCHDDPKGDGTIHLVASDSALQAPILSFIITQTDEAIYFGQICGPALWLNRTAQDRFEPAAVETLHRIERNEIHNNAFFRLSQYQCADLMVEQRNGILCAPMTRPSAGSRWVTLTNGASNFLPACSQKKRVVVPYSPCR